MTRMVMTLSLALFLALSSMAAAGGENCDKSKGLDVEKSASSGYVVTGVANGSPAEQAGFQKGDVLVAFNGIALTDENKDALKKAKMQNAVGKQVTYTISRAGAERQIAATLAEVPAEVLAQWEKEYDRAVAVAQTDN
jgi:serine protease Do